MDSTKNNSLFDRLRRLPAEWIKGILVAVVLLVGLLTIGIWGPEVRALIAGDKPAEEKPEDGHAAHDDSDLLELSDAAKRNIGLKLATVHTRSYTRSMTVPAIVVHRPGRTRFQISAPMTGVVTDIAIAHGQAVWSDSLLFKLRLTHEDLVRVQTDYLRTLGQLDVELAEIKRLKKFVGKGVAGTVVLEKEYARDKLQAMLQAQRESLLLHGLTADQVQAIKETRKLRHDVTVVVPRLHLDQSLHFEHERDPHSDAKKSDGKSKPHKGERHRFIIEQLPVHIGQAVKAGETLCVLADYDRLYLEGRAFGPDAYAISRVDGVTLNAAASSTASLLLAGKIKERTVTAITQGSPGEEERIPNLQIAYVDNEIDIDSRSLHFFVALPNSVLGQTMRDKRPFITWKFRPGQRMQVRVPVTRWENVIVLPAAAVAQDGVESYVFVENGSQLERRPVVVRYRDQYDVVVEPGPWVVLGLEKVAMNAAHQLLVALKIKAGGGGGHHHHHH